MPIASTALDVITIVAGTAIGLLGLLVGRKEHREAARLRERGQAEKIVAWAERRTGEGRWITATNGSEQVVKDVRVWLVAPAAPAPERGVPDRRPSAHTDLLEPGKMLEHLIPASAMRGAPPAERPSVVLAFRDVDGRQWVRSAGGQLDRGR